MVAVYICKNVWIIAQNIVQSTYNTKIVQHNSPVSECIKPFYVVVSIHTKTSMYNVLKPGHWAGA